MLRNSSCCLGWCLAITLAACTGCTSLNWSAKKEAGPKTPTSQCTVEFRAKGKEPVARNVEIPADATVQKVLDKSGAQKKFARMQIELYRKGETGGWHRMPVEYDRGSKKVVAVYDYHVRPDDRLVITEDPRDILDDMMQAGLGGLGGGLGGMTGKR